MGQGRDGVCSSWWESSELPCCWRAERTGEKTLLGAKQAQAYTKQRKKSPWTQREKQINKQEITFPSLALP